MGNKNCSSTNCSYEEQFYNACVKGDGKSLKKIYKKNMRSLAFISDIKYERSFQASCSHGHLKIVRLLYKWKPTLDISTKNEFAFQLACKYGQLEVVKQLLEWKPTINISTDDEYAFRMACKYGHIDLVRLLYEMRPTLNISAKKEFAFRYACENGHLELVQQLYKWKSTINVSELNQSLSYQNEIIEFLESIGATLISRFTKMSIVEGEELDCPICFETLTGECCKTKCNHKFCHSCIKKWVNEHSTCPCCRKNL